MLGRENTTADYDGRRTLVIGDVNTGKTRFTETILARWIAQGRSQEIVVLDLAPETQETIGGRIHLPPLRNRKEDVPLLARYFVDAFNREFRKDVTGLAPEVLRMLGSYAWPGNVRELKNAVERAVLLAEGVHRVIALHDLGIGDLLEMSGRAGKRDQQRPCARPAHDRGIGGNRGADGFPAHRKPRGRRANSARERHADRHRTHSHWNDAPPAGRSDH